MLSNITGSVKTGVHNFQNTVVNVSNNERIASVAIGVFVLTRAIKKVSLLRAVLGGYLIYRG